MTINVKPLSELEGENLPIQYTKQRKRDVATLQLPLELANSKADILVGDTILKTPIPSDGKITIRGNAMVKKLKQH